MSLWGESPFLLVPLNNIEGMNKVLPDYSVLINWYLPNFTQDLALLIFVLNELLKKNVFTPTLCYLIVELLSGNCLNNCQQQSTSVPVVALLVLCVLVWELLACLEYVCSI